MRVLQVGTGFASIPPSGAYATERIIHHQSVAFTALGHEVTVLDIRDSRRPPVPYDVAEVDFPAKSSSHIAKGFLFASAIKGELARLLQNHKFDIVTFHNQFSAQNIPLIRRLGVPSAYCVHNGLWSDAHACRSCWHRLKFLQELRAMRLASVIICQNETTSRNLGAAFDIPPHRRAVAPLGGISADWLKCSDVSMDAIVRYSPNREAIVLNVARIAPYKNQLTLIRAMRLVLREVTEARLVLAGPASDKRYHRRLVRETREAGLTNQVLFTGEVPHSQLRDMYALCSVFVCPSLWEAFGVVVTEAMAQGRAIVASDVDSFVTMLSGGRGITVAPYDDEALAKAIICLLRNKALREEMGHRAKEYVKENCTWETVAKRTLAVYEAVRSGRNAAA